MKYCHTFALAVSLMAFSGVDAALPTGVDRANLDTTVSPGTDFYDYACGGWMKANPLGDEFSRYGTFDRLGELTRQQVRDLVVSLDAAASPEGSNARKIAVLYAQGMDSTALNAAGAQPLKADLDRIMASERADLPALMASIPGISAFFDTYVEADMLDASRNSLYWSQGGMGLGDRDYYLDDSDNARTVRDAYRTCLNRLARLAGLDAEAAQRLADNTLRIETELARAAMSREEQRDPQSTYNPMTMAAIEAEYAPAGLRQYYEALGLKNVDNVIVGQPKSLKAVSDLMKNEPVEALRDYIAAGYLSSAANYLSDEFVDAQFALRQILSGVKEQQPRWKRALSVPNGMMGEAVGELYVARYFPPRAKARMIELVSNLQTALGQHIDNLTWMSDETKAKAHEKLSTFTVKVGYPDKWRDYSGLAIDADKPYWHNVQQAMRFNADFNLADFGKSVDKDRWYMSPQTVNAYYNPSSNEICFPAGILQAPYFNMDADDAENYGAIGVVIGHEMTHGYDDKGRQFDKDGNLSNWWTDADAAAFTKLADGLVAQFDAIEVAPGVHANGRFTLGEDIADQGGLRVAHTAYHNSLGKDNPGQVIDGFTPDQRFYLAYANVWAGNIRPAEILKRTKTDPHSLGRWRVNASLRNIEPFFEAFGITEGQPMFRDKADRVVIW